MEAKEARIHEIDGLRGIAILAVIVLHWFSLPLHPLLFKTGAREVLNILTHGVDLFFVISGFLIGTILQRIENSSGMRAFYIRRIVRIWPLYYLLLVLIYLALPEGSMFSRVPYWSFTFFIFNFWESFGEKLHLSIGMLWSVAIEEQFYMLGPILFSVFNRKQISFFLLAYIFLSPISRLILVYTTDINLWRFTPVRIDGIAIGLLLSMFLSSSANVSFVAKHIKIFKYLMFLLLLLLLPAWIIFPGYLWVSLGYSLMVLTFGCVLLVVQVQCSLGQRIPLLNWGLLRYMGLRCYSIYLFHISISYIAITISDNVFIDLIIESALILLLAHFFWRYVEMPFINLGRKFSYRKIDKLDHAPA